MSIWFILLWLWIGVSVGILVAALMGAASRGEE